MQAATVSPFQNTAAATNNTGAAAVSGAATEDDENSALKAVDFQNFLTLLTAQLRNQDPLNPAESTEFVAQLAQFSSVEQLVTANSKLDNISSALVAGGIEKYASWIGKEAQATGAPAYFDGQNPVRYRLNGNLDAIKVETVISDKSGKELTRFNSLNTTAAQTWNGKVGDTALAPGSYAVTAIYYGPQDKVLGQEIANTYGGVREVRLSGNEPAIILEGGIEVGPEQIAGLGAKS